MLAAATVNEARGLQRRGETALLGSLLAADVVVVPHHGSANNMEPIFFKRVTADHYVFSGAGEHGNPERETVEMLFAARRNEPFLMHFPYPLVELDKARKLDWEKAQAEEKKSRKKAARPDWSAEKNSLRKFFDRHPLARGQKLVEIESDTRPHVIDLLDPIDF